MSAAVRRLHDPSVDAAVLAAGWTQATRRSTSRPVARSPHSTSSTSWVGEVAARARVPAGLVGHAGPVVAADHDRVAGPAVVRRPAQRRAAGGRVEQPADDVGADVGQVDEA